jgi:RNA polymerase sigma-70 factor (ECF subfamily)
MGSSNSWRRRGRGTAWSRFEDVYSSSFVRVYAYCLRRTRSREDAEDAVADTFVVAWRRLDDLLAAEHRQAWLYGVARRVLANQRKVSERHERTEKRAMSFAPSIALDNPAQDAEHRLRLAAVLDGLAQLAETDQELLLLAAFEQLSHAEMAIVLETHVETIKSRLYRARQRLQDLIELQADTSTTTHISVEEDGRHA